MKWRLLPWAMSFFIVLGLVGVNGATSQVTRVRKQIKSLRKEIKDLRLSAQSLDEVHAKLLKELDEFESKFKARMGVIVVPLLSWPERLFTLRADSWTELERAALVMKEVKKNLVREPLKLMSSREIRIEEVKALKKNLEENISELESKKELFGLRLEDLKTFEKKKTQAAAQSTNKNN